MSEPEIKQHPVHENYLCYSDGRIYSKMYKRFLNPKTQNNGYLKLSIGTTGKQKGFLHHRFIMEAFHGASKLFVNHKNGIKTDNRIENLEYCTARENLRHALDTGLRGYKKGEAVACSKITEDQALTIITMLNAGIGQWAIAKTGIASTAIIQGIAHGKSWKHLGLLEYKGFDRTKKRGPYKQKSVMIDAHPSCKEQA